MAMLMMGVALITMAPHQAQAQSNDCHPLNLGAEIVNGDPVLTWDTPTDCTPASYDVWRKAKVNGSWIEKLSIHATSIKGHHIHGYKRGGRQPIPVQSAG